jgi:hypothetical protein
VDFIVRIFFFALIFVPLGLVVWGCVRPHAEEDAFGVDVHDEVPVFGGDVDDLVLRGHAGVVDRDCRDSAISF